MPKDSSRQPLPTSSSDFALPPSSSPGASSFSSVDDPNFLFNRIRRPSLLQRSHHSPLANTLSFHVRRRSQASALAEESESEKERMSTESPSSSETHTPPLRAESTEEDIPIVKPKPVKAPATPPRRRSSASIDTDMPTVFHRRLNHPVSSSLYSLIQNPHNYLVEATAYSQTSVRAVEAGGRRSEIRSRLPAPYSLSLRITPNPSTNHRPRKIPRRSRT